MWFICESDYTDHAQFCSLESRAVLWRGWIMQETLSKYFSMVFWLPQEKTACVRTLNRNKRHSVSVLIFFKWKSFHSLFLFKIWHLGICHSPESNLCYLHEHKVIICLSLRLSFYFSISFMMAFFIFLKMFVSFFCKPPRWWPQMQSQFAYINSFYAFYHENLLCDS